MRQLDPVLLARQWAFVREEGGQNRGVGPVIFQWFTGNAPGDSWCASFVSFVLYQAFAGQSPVVRSAATSVMLAQARMNNWVTTTPEYGDLFFYVQADGTPHHVGFFIACDAQGVPTGIAGNTSADGLSSNGDRVAEHPLGSDPRSIVYVHYPR